jgi:hypothetical protein
MVNLNEDGVERRSLVWVVGVMERKREELHISGKRERREGWRKVCHLIQKISFVVVSRQIYFKGLLKEKTGCC